MEDYTELHNKIKEMLDVAKNAPSGDNSQPWKFKLVRDTLEIYNVPERGLSAFDHKEYGSFVSHGALIENIIICAEHFGFDSELVLFPSGSDKELVATIKFSVTQPVSHYLFEAVNKRHTNRKFQKTSGLEPDDLELLLKQTKDLPSVKFSYTDNREKIDKISKVLPVDIKVFLQTRYIHEAFFKNLVWTKKEENYRKTGLYFDTMELKLPQKMAFRIIQFWPVLKILNRLGLYKKIQADLIYGYKQSGMIGVISIPEIKKENYINAGRLMERMWLAAIAKGLGFHIVSGTMFLYQKVVSGDGSIQDKHHKEISEAYEMVKDTLGIVDIPVIIFRAGYTNPATAKSSKLELDSLLVK